MTTVTQFQKPGARDANNSNPVSNMPMVMKFYAKKKIKFYINGEGSSDGFSATVIRGIPETCKCNVNFNSNTLQTT